MKPLRLKAVKKELQGICSIFNHELALQLASYYGALMQIFVQFIVVKEKCECQLSHCLLLFAYTPKHVRFVIAAAVLNVIEQLTDLLLNNFHQRKNCCKTLFSLYIHRVCFLCYRS